VVKNVLAIVICEIVDIENLNPFIVEYLE